MLKMCQPLKSRVQALSMLLVQTPGFKRVGSLEILTPFTLLQNLPFSAFTRHGISVATFLLNTVAVETESTQMLTAGNRERNGEK